MTHLQPTLFSPPQQRQCLNYVWLGLKFADGTENLEIIPPEYIQNVNEFASKIDSKRMVTDLFLWLDYRRHSEQQIKGLRQKLAPNIIIRDLCDIEDYTANELYNRAETNPEWRNNKSSLIWQQVDAARILVCLHQIDDLDNCDRVFYADMDVLGIDLNNPELCWEMKRGCAVTSVIREGFSVIENQFFGFPHQQKPLFEKIYMASLADAEKGKNGWSAYSQMLARHMSGEDSPIMACHVAQLWGKGAYHPTTPLPAPEPSQ